MKRLLMAALVFIFLTGSLSSAFADTLPPVRIPLPCHNGGTHQDLVKVAIITNNTIRDIPPGKTIFIKASDGGYGQRTLD
jgi:hypothetical protein